MKPWKVMCKNILRINFKPRIKVFRFILAEAICVQELGRQQRRLYYL